MTPSGSVELSWPAIHTRLTAGSDLTSEETAWAMGQIMAGDTPPEHFGAFVAALKTKGETAAEVNGLVDQMLEQALVLDVEGPTLDVVGTGATLPTRSAFRPWRLSLRPRQAHEWSSTATGHRLRVADPRMSWQNSAL